MNTRGLTELVVLTIGREAGVIDDKLFTMLVIMAVVTTAMAGPLLKIVYPDRWLNRDIAEAERRRTSSATDRIAIVVDDPATAQPLAEIAAAYGGGRASGAVTIVRFTEQGAGLAAFADDLGEMKVLRETIERAGLTCQVISRASADRGSDVTAEIQRLAPSAVVIGPSDRALIDPIRHVGSDVLEGNGSISTITGVSAKAGNSNAELASIEMAVRIALFAGVTLYTGTGLASRQAKQIDALGVTRATSPVDGAVTVGPEADNRIIVHPGERDRLRLAEALDGWARTEPLILSPL